MNELLKIHDTYRKVDGILVQMGKHVPKSKVYRIMINHSNDKGHEYHKYHRFSEQCIHEIIQKILAS
ncbi:hypothetical protein ACFPA1_25045 [Neobacillus sp. GCM10023253]|uniref:hypothetical protein n=1 Tax=Neobacillus sp. GCM10023253 TaxID=3252644 RepID=UPI00361B1DC2